MDVNKFFTQLNRRMCVHLQKLMKQQSKTVARFNFFAQKVKG